MTLLELKKLVDFAVVNKPDQEVVIILDEPSMGPRANTPIVAANSGFDWENGLFVLLTKEKIHRKI